MQTLEVFHAEQYVEKGIGIYEAVLIISRRARQISELQKRRVDRHLGMTEILEQAAARARAENGDEMPEPEPIDRDQIKFEKPLIISLRELLDDKVKYQYEE